MYLIILGYNRLNALEDDDLIVGNIVVDLVVDPLAHLVALLRLGFNLPHVI